MVWAYHETKALPILRPGFGSLVSAVMISAVVPNIKIDSEIWYKHNSTVANCAEVRPRSLNN